MAANDYLDRAVDRVLAMQKLVMVDDPVVAAKYAQKFLHPLPPSYPCWVNFPGGGANARTEDDGFPYDRQTFTVSMRYLIGKVGDGYDGSLQSRLWVYQVAVVNFFNTHPDLIYEDDQDDIPELEPDGVSATVISRFGVFRDMPEHLGIQCELTLPFHIDNEDEFF